MNTPNKISRIYTSEESMQMRLESGEMETILSCQIQNLFGLNLCLI